MCQAEKNVRGICDRRRAPRVEELEPFANGIGGSLLKRQLTAEGAGSGQSKALALEGMGARIGHAADAIGTREVAARAMGVSPAALQRYVRGANNPPFDALARLCLRAGIRMEWLATGEGQLRVGESADYSQTSRSAEPRWRVAEAHAILKQAGDAAGVALGRVSGQVPDQERLALAVALVDEAVGTCDAAAGPLAYLIEAVYELLANAANSSPAQVVRVIRNALTLRG